MKKGAYIAWLLALALLLPLAVLIDVAIGDFVTGVTRTPKQKLAEHVAMYKDSWHNA